MRRSLLELKTAWRDGTTQLVMSPPQFMQRLAALKPKPRLHLISIHGVLAPSSTTLAKLRAQAVPQGPEPPGIGHTSRRVRRRVVRTTARCD